VKSDCNWCKSSGDGTKKVCRAGNEETCSYKTLPYQKDEIIKRIDFEMDYVKKFLSNIKEIKDKAELQDKVRDMADRLSGVKMLMDVLRTDFDYNYRNLRNPLEFSILVAKANKHLKKAGLI
jgi:hypothetical protein